MNYLYGLAVALTITGAIPFASADYLPDQDPASPQVASLVERGEGLAIRHSSPVTGLPSFASTDGKGILLPDAARAADRALGFIDLYGSAFGLSRRENVRILRAERDELGLEHVRLQQTHMGVPVTGGEFIVHFKGDRVVATNGRVVGDLPADVTPVIGADAARSAAVGVIRKYLPAHAPTATYSVPRLEVFNRGMFDDVSMPSRLAWFVEASGFALRQYIWVDAQTGGVLLQFSQLPKALDRRVYNAGGGNTLPGTLVRTEGTPDTSDVDANNVYWSMWRVHEYFLNYHGRDSFDGAGATMISTVHYDDVPGGTRYDNAFWNGTQAVFGEGWPVDDIVGHEFTHGLIDHTARLYYYSQSGALSESYADILGEAVQRAFSSACDVCGGYTIGEQIPGHEYGGIKNLYSRKTTSDASCTGNVINGNDLIPSYAYVLMTVGADEDHWYYFGIGWLKSTRIHYRALTTYLTSGSNFIDHYNALNQACEDLIGTSGITENDCRAVSRAAGTGAKLHLPLNCTGAVLAPAVCPTQDPFPQFSEDFDDGSAAGWTPQTPVGPGAWSVGDTYAHSGRYALAGREPAQVSDHAIATPPVALPAGARLYFDSAFDFEKGDSSFYDGGVIEYSTDGGTSWVDGSTLIDAGKGYGGTIATGSGNPLAGRSAFVGTSYGFTGTRLNLASLAGQTVQFRFRIGTDASGGGQGWTIDTVSIYYCGGTAPVVTLQPVSQIAYAGREVAFTAEASGSPAPVNEWWFSTNNGDTHARVWGATARTYRFHPTIADNGKVYRAYFYNGSGGTLTAWATLTVRSSSGSDFNGDRQTDFAVYRPATGMWYIRGQSPVEFGGPGDVPVAGDYDGNGSTDVAVYRPATGTWSVRDQFAVQYGDPGDVPVPGDYDGNGTTDIAVYRRSTGQWFVRGQFTVQYGGPGDLPLVADFNGDGTIDVAVYRPSTGTWYVHNQFSVQFGDPGDVPMPADYNGDGSADVAVYRTATGTWFVRGQFSVKHGEPGDLPLARDFNGDGIADIAVYHPLTGEWRIRDQATVQFGEHQDMPVPRGPYPFGVGGDYSGTGVTDIAVYRPSTGMWFVRNRAGVQFGDAGDTPVPADYDGDGRVDIAVFRPSAGVWYARSQFAIVFGENRDIPVPGDYTGDGRADLAVYRPSTGDWYVRGGPTVHVGEPGDVPVPGDYDGDGSIDRAIYRPSTAQWIVHGLLTAEHGGPEYTAVPGDYNGDGLTDVAVFHPPTGRWFVMNQYGAQFGDPGDVPVPGDYNGDRVTDIAVYRPSTGTWYVRGLFAVQHGDPGDLPIVRIGPPQ